MCISALNSHARVFKPFAFWDLMGGSVCSDLRDQESESLKDLIN